MVKDPRQEAKAILLCNWPEYLHWKHHFISVCYHIPTVVNSCLFLCGQLHVNAQWASSCRWLLSLPPLPGMPLHEILQCVLIWFISFATTKLECVCPSRKASCPRCSSDFCLSALVVPIPHSWEGRALNNMIVEVETLRDFFIRMPPLSM